MARSIPVGGIFISITGNSADFRKAVKSARSEIWKLRKAFAPIASVARTAGIALAGFGVASVAMGKNLADGIDNLGKLSTSLRTSVADLQEFEIAAGLQGVDFTKATNAMKRLAVITGDISSGAAYSEVTDEWDKLGLRIEEVVRLPVTEQFKRITQAIREQIPAAEQLSVASAFFGTRNAADVMRITAETTEQATRVLRDYGIELTNARTKGVEEMNDAMLVLNHIFKNFARNIVADYAPAVKAWVMQVQDGLRPGGRLREVLEGIAYSFRVAARAAVEFVDIMSTVITREVALTAAVVAVSLSVLKVANAAWVAVAGLKGFMAAMAGTKTIAGALGLVLGLGSGGLGAVLVTLFAAGGLVAAGVALYRSLNAEMETAEGVTMGLAMATDRLRKAKMKMHESDLKAQIEHAKSAKRLEEIIAGGQGYITREQAIKAQRREVEDLERRLAEISSSIRRTDRDTPGVPEAGSEPLRLDIGGADPLAAAPHETDHSTTSHIGRSVSHAKTAMETMNEVAKEIEDANRKAAEASKAVWMNVGESIKMSMGQTIDGIIDGANDLGDILDNILKTMAKMAVKSSIFGALGSSGLGIPGFAGGGLHRGGMAVVGENGPELISTNGPARIYSNRDMRRMMGGADLSVSVKVQAVNDGALRNALDREFGRVTPQIVEMSKSAMVSDINRPSSANSAVRRA